MQIKDKTMRFFILISLFNLISFSGIQSQEIKTVTRLYKDGDIPTSFSTTGQADPTCNGPLKTLSILIPSEPYPVQIIGMDIEYNMTALFNGYVSDQVSKVFFQNKSIGEDWVHPMGVNLDQTGTYPYSRSSDIANGVYDSGEALIFEMWAIREFESTAGCNSLSNKVDDDTWRITLNYIVQTPLPNVGVGTITPSAVFDVAGKLKVGDDYSPPLEGQIKYDPKEKDFYGYNGEIWVSFSSDVKNSGTIFTNPDPDNLPVYKSSDGITDVTITSSNGLLYDTGGPYADYDSDENYKFTFSSQGQTAIKLTIIDLDLAQGDSLFLKYFSNENLLPYDAVLPYTLIIQPDEEIIFKSTFLKNKLTGFKIKYEYLFRNLPEEEKNENNFLGGWVYNQEKRSIFGGLNTYPYTELDSLGNYALKWGQNNISKGTNSYSFGIGNTSSADFSSTFGASNFALGGYSYARGVSNIVRGLFSTAWGNSNYPNGQYTTAWGSSNSPTGSYSTTWGYSNSASGDYATSWGEDNEAVGNYSTTWGRVNAATGVYSSSWGQSNNSNGAYSTTFGHGNNANGFGTFKIGINSLDFGGQNATSPQSTNVMFQVGNGVLGGSKSNALTLFYSGDLYIAGTYYNSSDYRLKKEINPVSNSLTKLQHLSAYNYYWKSERNSPDLQTGILAQEVQKVFPELVTENGKGELAVNYLGLIPHLIEAVKELKKENEELNNRLLLLEQN